MPSCPWDVCGGGPRSGLVGFLWGAPFCALECGGMVTSGSGVAASGTGGAPLGGLDMLNTCMPCPLEVPRLHIGGACGPDAVQAVGGLDLAAIDVLVESLLSSVPRPVDDVPTMRCGLW